MSEDQTQSTDLSTTPLLNAALAKAQGSMQNAEKDRTNPHFKSKYATLASSFDACRAPLSENGLSLFQNPETMVEGVKTVAVRCITELRHSSGERLVSSPIIIPVAAPNGAQQIGSAISYARRYQMQAMIGIAAAGDDDDGNAAQGDGQKQGPVQSSTPASRPAARPQPKAETAAEAVRKPGVVQALREDQARASMPPPPPHIAEADLAFDQHFPEGDLDQSQPAEGEPVTLLDKLVSLAAEYSIPNERMSQIIRQVTGTSKRSVQLDSNELTKVINWINLTQQKPK